MRRFVCFPSFVLFCVIAIFASNAGAVGLGGYIEYGSGSSDWNADDLYNFWDFETDTTFTGYGFVLDTNVARDRLFNYRLQIGYEKEDEKVKTTGEKLSLKGISITNDFGFGVLRTPQVRLWLGPELKFAYLTGSPDLEPNLDIKIFKFGIGPVAGANFNIGKTFTLALKTGYLFQGFVGDGDWKNNYNYIDYDGTLNQFFVNLSVICRLNDFF